MRPIILSLLIFAFSAYGQQQKRIAIINIVDDGSPPLGLMELNHLTDRLRVIASDVLPDYAVASDSGEIVDYAVSGRIGRFGENFTIKVELRDSSSLVGVFSDNSKDIYGLLSVLNEKAPILFSKLSTKPPVAAPAKKESMIVAKAVAAGYTGTNKCHKEIFELTSTQKGFNMSSFVKDLGISVAKVQASCKTKFTCPADDKITDVGLTAGCVKQLPAKPDGIISLLKEIGLDAGLDLVQDLAAQSPVSIDPQVNAEKSGGGSFWVALALDLVGAGLITYGFVKNSEAKDLHSEYRAYAPYANSYEIDARWEKADDARSTRNTLYVVGSLFLATGIGVHIWF